MPRKRATIKQVKLEEISFVGSGDNPEAHVTLLKIKPLTVNKEIHKNRHAEGLGDTGMVSVLKKWAVDHSECILKGEANTFNQIIEDREIRSKFWDLVWIFEESISSILNSGEEDKSKLIQQSIDEFRAASSTILKAEGEKIMPVELKKQLETATEKITALEKENADLKKEAEDLKKKNEALEKKNPATETPIDKSLLPEAVRKELDRQEEINKANAIEIQKLKDENITRTYIGKASEVPLVGGIGEVSELLKNVAKHDTSLADKVLDIFRKADARIKEGDLLKEKGKLTNEGSGATAYDKLVAKSVELRKAKPELTEAQAFTMVYDTDEELRKAYLAESRNNE